MAALIHIETSTNVCSVAFSRGNKILWNRENHEGQSHSVLLGKYIDELLAFVRMSGILPDGVAVSCGPGSYTGLRIGVSMAKGLCSGWNVPLLSIPTLDILAQKAILSVPCEESTDALYCAMIDARRMEVYAALYDCPLQKIRNTEAVVITENSFSPYLDKQKIYFFGNGAEKCKNLLCSPNAVFIDGMHPLAGDMVVLSEQAYREKHFEDVAYFEPVYLKDFVATVPRGVAWTK